MRKIFYLLALLLISFSCVEEENLQKPDSVYKPTITTYVEALKKVTKVDLVDKLEDFSNSLDFKNVGYHNLRTTEKLLIADLNNLRGYEGASKVKAIFFINSGEAVRSNIVVFNDAISFSDYDKVILSVLNGTEDRANYSGKISFYSPTKTLVLFDEFEKGEFEDKWYVAKKTKENCRR